MEESKRLALVVEEESNRLSSLEAEDSKRLALLAAAAECSKEEYDEINEHIQNLPLKDQVLLTTTTTTTMNEY
jgi:hypothetical protein